MRQGLTTISQPRHRTADRGVPSPKNGSGQIAITTWMNTPLLILSLSLLSMSVFSGPLVSAYHLGILLMIGAGALYATSSNGTATERIELQRLVLFLVVLMNIYFINLTDGWPTSLLYGRTPVELASLIALTVFALCGFRIIHLRAFKFIHAPLDLAVLVLCLVTSACFLGLHVLLSLSSQPLPVKYDLLWVVLVATLLHYVFGNLLQSEAVINRTLQLLLFPLAVAVMGTIALWLAVIASGIVIYGHSAGLVKQRRRESRPGRA
jgi:hypothetical protein